MAMLPIGVVWETIRAIAGSTTTAWRDVVVDGLIVIVERTMVALVETGLIVKAVAVLAKPTRATRAAIKRRKLVMIKYSEQTRCDQKRAQCIDENELVSKDTIQPVICKSFYSQSKVKYYL
jgi:hypothetical protein